MGFFGTLKNVVNIATLGQVTFLETQLELGGKVLKVTIDVNNEVVRVGEEVFKAVPGEVLFPGLGPLAGLLKNEIEDELILLNPLGVVPSITVFINGALVIGDLLGVVQHRTMREDELRVVHHVFDNSLKHSDQIILTNLAGIEGRPFAVPAHTGGAILNLGGDYVHDDDISDVPLLIHELVHAWQIQQSLLPEVFVCNGALVQIQDTIGESVYDYEPGEQWSAYGLEQQAHIVEDWVVREPSAPTAPPMKLNSPVFRYVNANVRLRDSDRQTSRTDSVRALLAEGGAKTGSLRQINPPRPQAWW